MRKFLLAVLPAVLCGIPLAKASDALAKHPETVAVLQLLYNDEITAARTYWAYARQARLEKQENVESFFAALELSATIRAEAAEAVLNVMEVDVKEPDETGARVSSTKFNLKLMTNVEAPKMEKRYPLLIDRIKPEAHAVAIQTVTHAWKVDTGHRELAESILSSMDKFWGIGAQIAGAFYVCANCGAVDVDIPELTCPVCAGPISGYERTDAKWRFYRAIDGNPLLDDEEKAFAKRVYDRIYDTSDRSQDPALGRDALTGVVYEKWGLGEPREFCPEEKTYIIGLAEMAAAWDAYNAIDADAFDEADKTFLREMHDKYGAGPINLRKEQAKERTKVSPDVEKILDMVETVCGRTDFEDRELIFLRNLIAKSGT